MQLSTPLAVDASTLAPFPRRTHDDAQDRDCRMTTGQPTAQAALGFLTVLAHEQLGLARMK